MNSWDESYKRKDNYLFYPNEEVIRFFNKYLVKRLDVDEYKFHYGFNKGDKLLDLGCGVGRHLTYGLDMKFDVHGIDLSENAIVKAKEVIRTHKNFISDENVVSGSAADLPWDDNYFDVVVSHGVLDSMPFDVAKGAIKEVNRVIKDDGLFYCDLISGNELNFFGEKEVTIEHEKGTIQSYFNLDKIEELVSGYFEIIECRVNETTFLIGDYHGEKKYGRYHIILKVIK